MNQPNVTTYDPRKGENFVLALSKEKTFSSLEHGFLVVDSIPKSMLFGLAVGFDVNADLAEVSTLLMTCIQCTASKGFFTCVPKPDKLNLDGQDFEFLDAIEDSICGYFTPIEDVVAKLLNARVGHESEEWILGSCFKEFSKPQQVSAWSQVELYDFAYVLSEPENIGCLFYQQGNWLTIMSRLFDGIDELFERLKYPTAPAK